MFVGVDHLYRVLYNRSKKPRLNWTLSSDKMKIFKVLCDTHSLFWKAPSYFREAYLKENYYISLLNIPDILKVVLSDTYSLQITSLQDESRNDMKIKITKVGKSTTTSPFIGCGLPSSAFSIFGISASPDTSFCGLKPLEKTISEFTVRDYIYVTESGNFTSRLIEPSSTATFIV